MTAAVWSTPPDTAAFSFPARTLMQFMHNHHLLQLTGKPVWLTLAKGSKSYVDAILSKMPPEKVHMQGVQSVEPTKAGEVWITTEDGVRERYDHVILATHADTSLQLLGSHATAQEKSLLGKFEFGKNTAVLHHDTKVCPVRRVPILARQAHGAVQMMPKRRSCWSAWNYLTFTDVETGKANVNKVSLLRPLLLSL